jgi:hypothetical protein
MTAEGVCIIGASGGLGFGLAAPALRRGVGSVALVTGSDVLIDPRARAAPGPVGRLGGLQPAPDCGDTECVRRQVDCGQRWKRHEPGGASDCWHDELVEIAENRTREWILRIFSGCLGR